ncbi:DUF3141 domain-containing protein, partial [Burkholderia ubonensis]|uniref:DUF3141 domain-containing protein n=1 Tax=Burkholderia ubonensis TaxID=101571 RepID=UPI000B029C53
MSDVNHAVPSPVQCAHDAIEYGIDAWQRSVLLLDVLRERGNIYLDHARSGQPPVLAFEYEVIMDGRALPQPANYALARIVPPDGVDGGVKPRINGGAMLSNSLKYEGAP